MEREPADLTCLSLDELLRECLRIQAWGRRLNFKGPSRGWLAGWEQELREEIQRRLEAQKEAHGETETKDPG